SVGKERTIEGGNTNSMDDAAANKQPPPAKDGVDRGVQTPAGVDVGNPSSTRDIEKEQLLVALVNEWETMELISIGINLPAGIENRATGHQSESGEAVERNGWICKPQLEHKFYAGTILVLALPIEKGARCIIPL